MISFHDIAKGSRHVIRFLHVATGNTVEFPAFITDFSDSYNVSWGTEQIYGRMDPIKPYQGTTRTISLAFDVVSPDLDTARENMFNYSKLSQMMYPVYSTPLFGSTPGPGQKGRVLKAPPIMRLEFMNLITNLSQDATDKGLLGCINGVSFNPSQEAGFFTAGNEILSKAFNLSITLCISERESPRPFRTFFLCPLLVWDARLRFLPILVYYPFTNLFFHIRP